MIQYDEIRYSLNNLKPTMDELRVSLDLEAAEKEVAELQAKAQAPGFWDDPEESQKILQRVKRLQDKVERYHKLTTLYDDTMTLIEMADEDGDESLLPEVRADFKRFEQDLEAQRLETLLSGEYDQNNAIMSFHAGAGGTEAQDWTQMLFRMYTCLLYTSVRASSISIESTSSTMAKAWPRWTCSSLYIAMLSRR